MKRASKAVATRARLARRERARTEVDALSPTPAAKAGVFVAWPDGTFTCPDCTPVTVDLGDDAVETWELYGAGWVSAPICRDCKIAIPVFIDGTETEEHAS